MCLPSRCSCSFFSLASWSDDTPVEGNAGSQYVGCARRNQQSQARHKGNSSMNAGMIELYYELCLITHQSGGYIWRMAEKCNSNMKRKRILGVSLHRIRKRIGRQPSARNASARNVSRHITSVRYSQTPTVSSASKLFLHTYRYSRCSSIWVSVSYLRSRIV